MKTPINLLADRSSTALSGHNAPLLAIIARTLALVGIGTLVILSSPPAWGDEAEEDGGGQGGEAQIVRARAAKDSLFLQGEDSPLLASDRAGFDGLSYYPVDLRFRMVGDLHRYGRQRRVLIPTTGDTLVPMDRFGRLILEFEGKPFWLEVYRNPGTQSLSVFFTDASNGKGTYSGGRYAPVRDLGDGSYLIDFNEAYNPYCTYNLSYICPLPPRQNQLSFAVLAGEAAYGPDLAH